MAQIILQVTRHLNDNGPAIQGISTLVLVVVTVWYAISTKRMADLMRAQITAKIIIENPSVGSQLMEEWFLSRNFDTQNYFSVKALFDVRNEGNAAGSIYKPDLLISLPSTNLKYQLNPRTKSRETYNHSSTGSISSYDVRTINHGSSIFLYGGGSDKIELSYHFGMDTEARLNFVKEIQKNPSDVKYELVTRDNLGREYRIPVKSIFPELDFGLE